ncbi:uncharacterized protein LAESUDRAFT_711680 [Laetiporus sulphureus 93-53]|uniref:Uncharacterized protein n=1 Tax=Laetiporus sulphureus 93-53 TaxID=1314785 RepID=A0A165GLR9_9APHY|nr:uncharacterized protein LAESUDRAFT_711680 [Laetiporus sulphureus 93-53]KZT10526.1 hypothetical protein LAESUDRAFT_711680 [Laetiporus sulphureus 93-53]
MPLRRRFLERDWYMEMNGSFAFHHFDISEGLISRLFRVVLLTIMNAVFFQETMDDLLRSWMSASSGQHINDLKRAIGRLVAHSALTARRIAVLETTFGLTSHSVRNYDARRGLLRAISPRALTLRAGQANIPIVKDFRHCEEFNRPRYNKSSSCTEEVIGGESEGGVVMTEGPVGCNFNA